jgi:hypothetical protein
MHIKRHRLLGPAAFFRHEHPPVRNPLDVDQERQTLGQRVADLVATGVGSWPFIIVQSIMLVIWMSSNVYLALHWRDRAFDPYPFILLNLVLSFQAAYTGPVVIMNHLAYQNSILITMLERLGISHEEAESALRAHGVIDPMPGAGVSASQG